MEDRKNQPQGGLNEGEGSKTANKQYREAEREVENYRDEYERAEKSGRSRSAGDLESDLAGKNDGRL